MRYRICILLLCTLLLTGCSIETNRDTPPLSQQPSSSAPTPFEESVMVAAVAVETPVPLTPTPEPTPTPGPTPTPTPTPDPYEGVEKVVYKKDERFFYVGLTEALKEHITGLSFPEDVENARIGYDDLRYVVLMYIDYNGQEQQGELMVHKKLAQEVMEIFYELYMAGYQLSSVRLVDDYGQPGQDTLSMEDNNSSAFCYRKVNDSKKMSWHSFGAAIDINPVENPYINGSHVSPEEGRAYLNRKDVRPHMITKNDLAYKLFTKHGWVWGGNFKGDKDYQHFYKDIGYKR